MFMIMSSSLQNTSFNTLKKIGKTTMPFTYDLNQIPVIIQLGVMNKFNGLDLVDRMPKELWMEVHNFV